MYGVLHRLRSGVLNAAKPRSKGRTARDANEGSSKATQQRQEFKESTMKEKGKVLKKKGPKKERKGDTSTAKQITSSVAKRKTPPPPPAQLRDEGSNGRRSNGRRTYREEALSQSIGHKSKCQLWACMASRVPPQPPGYVVQT
jgi:hypothetical protein